MRGIKEALRGMARMLLDLLCPQDVRCLCCSGAPDEEEEDGLCADCRAALDELEARQPAQAISPVPGIVRAAAAYPYTAQARRLVISLKYHRMRRAAVPLARAMAMLPCGEAELLVPVPTTRKRRHARGYNQAQVLCELFARETGMPMADALRRTDERAAQTKLSGWLRRRNLTGVMTADERVRGRHILLIDDVYTTGSTAAEAARALGEAGALSVSVLTAAKSIYKEESKAGQSAGVRS